MFHRRNTIHNLPESENCSIEIHVYQFFEKLIRLTFIKMKDLLNRFEKFNRKLRVNVFLKMVTKNICEFSIINLRKKSQITKVS